MGGDSDRENPLGGFNGPRLQDAGSSRDADSEKPESGRDRFLRLSRELRELEAKLGESAEGQDSDDPTDWLSASQALSLVQSLTGEPEMAAASIIVRWAASDLVDCKCRLLRQWDDDTPTQITTHKDAGVRAQFWHQFGELDHASGSNWKVGDFKISWPHNREWRNTQLIGVMFRESQIRSAAPSTETKEPTGAPRTPPARRGAKRKDWWDHLWIEMIRRIRDGTLRPASVGELQGILEDFAGNELGENVGDSTLKPMASNLFKYLQESGGKLERE